jgi:spermidine/putrescine transport system substrate-binding protein
MSGSWNDMVNPTADGRAFLLDDFQEVIGAGNLVSGAELNSVDEGDVEKAKEWALSVKPKLRGFSTDDVQNMVSGNAWIHHGWNGDVVNIRNQVDKPENYSFQKCSEGIPLGTDCFAIPANAEHPGTALTFINFILDPENASKNIEYMGYPMPYTGPDETFAGLVKDDPAINVTVEDLESGQQFENLGAEGRRLWDRTWTEIKAG